MEDTFAVGAIGGYPRVDGRDTTRNGMAEATLEERLRGVLANRDRAGELRQLQPRWGVSGCAGLVDFFSNDYLGFARSRTLHQAITAAWGRLPAPYNGATGSRLLSGHSEPIEALERQLASFFKSRACLVFSSGYQANLAVFSALPQRGDVVWYDAHIHASVKDGVRLSYAEYHAFSHNDVDHLTHRLKAGKKQGEGQAVCGGGGGIFHAWRCVPPDGATRCLSAV